MHNFVSSKTLNEFALSSTKRGFDCTYLCNSATMVSFHGNVKFHTVNNDGYFWDKPLLGREENLEGENSNDGCAISC